MQECKAFELTQYLLEEDDDNTELIEYEFGWEASKYITIIDKNLGKGNYTVES